MGFRIFFIFFYLWIEKIHCIVGSEVWSGKIRKKTSTPLKFIALDFHDLIFPSGSFLSFWTSLPWVQVLCPIPNQGFIALDRSHKLKLPFYQGYKKLPYLVLAFWKKKCFFSYTKFESLVDSRLHLLKISNALFFARESYKIKGSNFQTMSFFIHSPLVFFSI